MKKILAGLCLVLCFYGCKEPFEYHPYELRLQHKYRNINERNIQKIRQIHKESDTIRFIMMGDTQRWYDETEKFVKHVNSRNDIDFVIHGGDISDFGMKKEFYWVHDMMDKLHVPYVALLGNHDVLGSGLEVYEAMYGDLNFSFIFNGFKFLCLNTNALEFDYAVSVPDWKFLAREIKDTVSDHHSTIAVMHVQPNDIVFNNSAGELFQEHLKHMKNLRFCLHAHAHSTMINDFFDDGIMYYGCTCMEDRRYFLFTVTKDSYEYEEVAF